MTLPAAVVVVLALALPLSELKGPDAALLSAAETADLAAIRSQLEAGADPDARNEQKQTPLIVAAQKGSTDVARLLLEAGADVDAKDRRGLSALVYAAGLGHLPLARALLAAGADVNSKSRDDATALMLASQNGHADIVAELLRSGAKANARGREGLNALLLALGSGHEELAVLLLEHGADANAANSMKDSPLMVAARQGQTATVRALLERGARVNDKNWNGDTPLIEAVRYRRFAIVPDLLEAGAKVEQKNHNGDTAPGLAKKFGDGRMTTLLESGVTPAPSEEAQAPLPTVTFGRRVSIPDMGPEWRCAERKTLAPPEKTHDVLPDYSDALQRLRQQGTVVLEARVNPEGRVTDVSVAGTPSLLDAAAIDAVRQWHYAPTVLCGTPVPVILTVNVSFTEELRLQEKRANRSFSRY
jgi:TonB family protein